MAVVGIPSDKIRYEGNFHPPDLPLPEKGSFWNYRVYKAHNCEHYVVYKVFYEDGKLLYRAERPAVLTGLSWNDGRDRSAQVEMERFQMAVTADYIVERVN